MRTAELLVPKSERVENRYSVLIAQIFKRHYVPRLTEFEFEREELEHVAHELDIKLPKNLGDVIYSFRYRVALPASIAVTADLNMEWVIEAAGRAKYRFKQVKFNRIVPREELITVKVPDSTPEIISAYTLNDEQALLAKIRYNRLIDLFLGVTAYSLQNHLRTTVKGHGQIEIDEIYVALDRHGRQFIIPVQAKGGTDQLGIVQTQQDIACCKEKFPGLICRAISAQFMSQERIALFELAIDDGSMKVVDERHYKLVFSSEITAEDLEGYGIRVRI
jgi:hypothetical protein